jgi:hypothetical protein
MRKEARFLTIVFTISAAMYTEARQNTYRYKEYDILGNYGIDKQRSSLDSAKLINLNRLSLQNDKTLALTYCFALFHHFTLDIVSCL